MYLYFSNDILHFMLLNRMFFLTYFEYQILTLIVLNTIVRYLNKWPIISIELRFITYETIHDSLSNREPKLDNIIYINRCLLIKRDRRLQIIRFRRDTLTRPFHLFIFIPSKIRFFTQALQRRTRMVHLNTMLFDPIILNILNNSRTYSSYLTLQSLTK